jgi:hypothetical protein
LGRSDAGRQKARVPMLPGRCQYNLRRPQIKSDRLLAIALKAAPAGEVFVTEW